MGPITSPEDALRIGSEPSDPVCRPASIAVVDERTQPRAVDVTQDCLQLPQQYDGFAWRYSGLPECSMELEGKHA